MFKTIYRRTIPLLLMPTLGAALAAQQQGVNPILSHPDPFITYSPVASGGRYVLTATTGHNITLWTGPSPSTATLDPKVVFTGLPGMTQIWSPTIWKLDGRWWIYFTAMMPGEKHRIYALESLSADVVGPYVFQGKLDTARPSIDPSLLEVNGERYLMYVTVDQGENAIWLRSLKSAMQFAGSPVLIAEPQYGWEKGEGTTKTWPVNEGPTALYHDGKTFIVYSASDTASPAYCLGILTLVGTDVMSRNSWKKTPHPVFESSPANGVYGPGRGTFAQAKDGTSWLLYAAKTIKTPTSNDRMTRAQPFAWFADGSPHFGSPQKDGPIDPER